MGVKAAAIPEVAPLATLEQLNEELVEEILARLPLQGIVSAGAVCKQWRALLQPGTYCRQVSVHHFGHRPWFFLAGLNHFLEAKNQAFGFDPEAGRWCRFSSFKLPPYDQGSLTGTHGLLFALAGTGICKIGFTPCLINNSSWRETPPLLFSRRSPIVAMVRKHESSTRSCTNSNDGYHIVVAGGKALSNQLVVEIYDSKLDAWQPCAPVPPLFRLSSSSQWMHSTVYKGKFIVYENHTGFMASLDVDRGEWSKATLLKPPNTVYAFIIACGTSLVLAGVCRNRPCVKLWLVNFDTLECGELGCMPDELFALFAEDDEKDPIISCVGGGDFIYVYADSWHKDYLVCLCDLSGGKVKWRKLPHLPAPVNRFDKVVCFSSSMVPDAML